MTPDIPEPATPRISRTTGPTADALLARHDPSDRADIVRDVVLAVPGVVALNTGAFGEIATYLPGRRVNGVRVRDDHTEISVVLLWGAPVLDTADAIRTAVTPLVGHRIDITIADVVDPTLAPEPLAAEPLPPEPLPPVPLPPEPLPPEPLPPEPLPPEPLPPEPLPPTISGADGQELVI